MTILNSTLNWGVFLKVKKLMCAVSALILTAVMLGGCSESSFGEQALLRPPRATGDKAEIQTVIGKEAGGTYTLKYPQNGDYRSAVNLFESDDGTEYAVALYSTESDSNMNVSIIAHEDGEWNCLGSFSNSGVGVDRIIFKDINADGKDEILVGWSTYNADVNTLSAYSMENETVREMVIDETYSNIIISDITGDKTEDIVLLSLRVNQLPSSVKLLQYSEQEKKPIAKFSLELDSEITAFSNIMVGKINKGKKGIVIDGEKSGGVLATQVIYFDSDEKKLCNPLVTIADNGSVANDTTRKDVITSRDIDEDGIIEVPVVTSMAAPRDVDAGTVCSMTSWRQLHTEDGSLQTKLTSIINYTDGYYFIMPDNWSSDVTALNDPDNRIITFYIWNSKTSSLGDKLLTIHRFTRSEWNKAEHNDYIMLETVKTNGKEAVIAAQSFHTDAIDSLNLTKNEIENCIRLIA